MDGDRAPLGELAALANDADAWLMVDDTPTTSISMLPLLWPACRFADQHTLQSSHGSYGGYICASQPVIDLIRNRART